MFPGGSLSRVMLCGGRVGRSHGNNLKEYKGKWLTRGLSISMSRVTLVSSLSNVAMEGALVQKSVVLVMIFLTGAKRNHFAALTPSGKSTDEYARRMHVIEKFHSHDIQSVDE